MATDAGRLDQIARPNLAGFANKWAEVVPDDSPPLDGSIGNTGSGCFGLYVSHAGFIRFISRGDHFGQFIAVENEVAWTPTEVPVRWQMGADDYEVQWLLSNPNSVRPYFTEGAYLWGEVVHVLAHDTTASGIFSLTI